ncbi:hypothetical protein O7599_18795 [Streptomyces sp. WMMC500]|uniref:hypothetical protein n=1 Tax=Streptomyces sp. WMMC500 TaxID=3015154 RepID=UPI00248BD96E|nr:hypothetical protein [Streptomyces sp. WMMC500]WBB57735.1 hypothetical protein O7599_18795 [Streptomyces sp. WMMC500]
MAEPERGGGRGRVTRGATLAGLLLWPLVCFAHACAVVWVYLFLGKVLFLLLLLPFVLTALILAGVTVLLWEATGAAEGGHDAALGWGFVALMFAYFCVLASAGDLMLRWQGTETTCTVRAVEERLDTRLTFAENVDATATRYDHELACPDGGPAEVTTDTGDLAAGDRVAVVYDPSAAWGPWGADTAEELDRDHGFTVGAGGIAAAGTGVWTLSVLWCAAAGIGTPPASRRRAEGPAPTNG